MCMWIQSNLSLWSNAEQGAPPCTWWMRTACIWTFSPRIWSSVTTTTRWVGERIEAPPHVNCSSIWSLQVTYAGTRQAQTVSLPLRPVIVFLPGFENEGQHPKSLGLNNQALIIWSNSTLSEIIKKQHWWHYPMSVCPGGAPQFGGGKLMREDLVVITVEYRSACVECLLHD